MAIFPAYYLYALNIFSDFSSADALVMTAVMLAESGGNTAASAIDPDGTHRGGLYMLPNDVGTDIVGSGRTARGKFQQSGFTSWPTYASGSYRLKLPQATTGRAQFDQSVASAHGVNGQPLILPEGLSREKAVAAAIVGLMGITLPIERGLGGALTGAGDVLEESVPAAVRGLVEPLADIGSVLSSFYDLMRWFTSPQNLWRVAKGIMGALMIFYGGMAIITQSSVGSAVRSGVLKTSKVGALVS